MHPYLFWQTISFRMSFLKIDVNNDILLKLIFEKKTKKRALFFVFFCSGEIYHQCNMFIVRPASTLLGNVVRLFACFRVCVFLFFPTPRTDRDIL